MRYGVKHYLLKPSNETEITQVIMSCVETCKSKSASRVDSLLTQLFFTDTPPEKLLQRKFFTELSGEQDVDLAKTQMIRLVMEASKKEYYPLSKLQTTDSLMAVNVCVTMRPDSMCGADHDLDLLCGTAAQIHRLCGKGHKVHRRASE